jgi:hypothetical protein
MLFAALFTIAKPWKQPGCPKTDEWIKKVKYLQTMEFYSANQLMNQENVEYIYEYYSFTKRTSCVICRKMDIS